MSKSKLPLVGIFGGTFDPIHYGHLRVAEEIIEAIGLQKMYFIPAGVPPLRHAPIASPQHRAEIVRIAIQDNSRFVLDEREINRGGISYSIDSLYELKQELGKKIVLCFVIGVDAFIKLDEWNNWHELFNLCHFIIAARPGHVLTSNHDVLPKELKDECSRRWVSSVDSLRNTTSG
ncbi:MAG: nicotinate-nucleotide adenylyltransferase, partial [Nitrosomonadaceae bacterium]